jgi:hypothetical protein
VLERAKTVHALDRAATVIGVQQNAAIQYYIGQYPLEICCGISMDPSARPTRRTGIKQNSCSCDAFSYNCGWTPAASPEEGARCQDDTTCISNGWLEYLERQRIAVL